MGDSTFVRILDMNERIDQTCHFCGTKNNVKYVLTWAIDTDGSLLNNEVACCEGCIMHHVWWRDIPQ